MQRIAKFEKVSFEQFKKDWQGEHPQDTEEVIREIYDGIRLPKRATAGSAGYDFFAPAAFTLKAGEMTKILTGIRARIDDGCCRCEEIISGGACCGTLRKSDPIVDLPDHFFCILRVFPLPVFFKLLKAYFFKFRNSLHVVSSS